MATGAAAIRSTIERRAAEAAARGRERAQALTAKLPMARDLLVARGARHTWLFGSLARGEVGETSDVDLAVEGLPSQAYFAVLAELMRLFAVRVDLVRPEEAGESLRACVREEGIAL